MFRFTIRDLLWLTLVVAMGLGWFVREWRWVDREHQLQAEVNRWEMAFRTAAQVFKHEGWDVKVDFAASLVSAFNDQRSITLVKPLGQLGDGMKVIWHPIKKAP